MKKKYNKRTGHSARAANLAPRTAAQFFAKPAKFQDTWTHVTHVISKMRAEGVSLTRASREFGVDPRTVLKLGKSALRKRASGRYAAKACDRLLRVLAVPTFEGTREVALRDSQQASLLGQYWDAVQRYLQTGDDSALQKFKGRKITDASRKRHLLLTNLNELNRLGSAGVLSFESLYARSI